MTDATGTRAGRRPVLCIMGPTAAGKTDLALELVRRLPADIVSVDSAMVYRGMDIGTAKPGPELLREAPHRLIDILDPAEPYSAARFRDDALREIEAIHAAGRVPLLVGGTMLYFRALERGLSALPAADPAVRAALEAELQASGLAALHARLARLDPAAARRIHPNDPQRTLRALEVHALTGRPMSELWTGGGAPLPYRFVKLVLAPRERGTLHRRIETRFLTMLEEGFLDEVRGLFARPDLGPQLPSMRAVGYRQAWEHLAGGLDRAAMVERAVTATRQYAKRQLTWLRAEPDAQWFDPQAADLLDAVLARLRSAGLVWDSTV